MPGDDNEPDADSGSTHQCTCQSLRIGLLLLSMANTNEMPDLVDESWLYDLAQSVIDAKRDSMIAKHRMNEIIGGRIYRSIRFLKESLVNPVWGFKNIKQVPSLFRTLEVDPIAYSLPTAKEYLEDTGLAHVTSMMVNRRRYMKYPHIKLASIGYPGIFSDVAHTFMVDRAEWTGLLDLGIDFLLITDHEKASTIYGKKTIETFRDRKCSRALVDDCAQILWWITDKEQLDNPQIDVEDVVIVDALRVSSAKTHPKSIKMLPSIDPTVHNPINWLNEPQTQLMVIGNQDQSKKAMKLIASGAPLITDGGGVLDEIIGSQYAFSKNPSEARSYFEKLADPLFRERQSIQARQLILREHSHLARFEKLLDELNINRIPVETISVIMSTMRQVEVEHGIQSVASQIWPNKQLVLILHRIKDADFDLTKIKKIISALDFAVVILDRGKDTAFGENLNLALDVASGEYVTKMDDDDYYGPNHLNDLHLAYHYSGAMAVGKWANFVYLTERDVMVDFVTHREERFVSHLPGATVFLKRHDLRQLRFGRVTRAIDSELYKRAEMRGGRLY